MKIDIIIHTYFASSKILTVNWASSVQKSRNPHLVSHVEIQNTEGDWAMYEVVFSGLSAVCGLASASLWVVASRVEIPAPKESAGVGALLGGYLIGRNSKGERIDLIETPKQQAMWNSRAAVAAAVTSGFAVCALVAHILAASHC
jgi:hypothetical protein